MCDNSQNLYLLSWVPLGWFDLIEQKVSWLKFVGFISQQTKSQETCLITSDVQPLILSVGGGLLLLWDKLQLSLLAMRDSLTTAAHPLQWIYESIIYGQAIGWLVRDFYNRLTISFSGYRIMNESMGIKGGVWITRCQAKDSKSWNYKVQTVWTSSCNSHCPSIGIRWRRSLRIWPSTLSRFDMIAACVHQPCLR
jgi:hypothetical protein